MLGHFNFTLEDIDINKDRIKFLGDYITKTRVLNQGIHTAKRQEVYLTIKISFFLLC